MRIDNSSEYSDQVTIDFFSSLNFAGFLCSVSKLGTVRTTDGGAICSALPFWIEWAFYWKLNGLKMTPTNGKNRFRTDRIDRSPSQTIA